MHRLVVFVATALCASSAAATTIAARFPVELSQRDKNLLVRAACSSVGVANATSLEVYTSHPKDSYMFADVRCAPHAVESLGPVVHFEFCSKPKRRWECNRGYGYDALQLTLPNMNIVSVKSADTPLNVAAELALAAAQQLTTKSRRIVPKEDGISNVWIVEAVDLSDTEGVEYFLIHWGVSSTQIIRDCTNGACQYSSAF